MDRVRMNATTDTRVRGSGREWHARFWVGSICRENKEWNEDAWTADVICRRVWMNRLPRADEPTEGANREDNGEGGVEARAPPSGTVKKGLRLAGRADAEKDGAPATLSAAPVHAGDARIREC